MLSLQSYGGFDKNNYDEYINAINYVLPDSYIAFLKEHNGGSVNNCIGKFERNSTVETFLLTTMFGLNVHGSNDLLTSYYDFKNRIPDTCIPIGEDAGGNVCCLNLTEPNYGCVYYWDHDEEHDEPITIDQLYFISDSFESFMESLDVYTEDDDDDVDVEGSDDDVWIDPDFLEEMKRAGNMRG